MVQAGDDGAMTRRVRGRWGTLLAFGCISDAAPIGFADRLEVGVRKGEVKDSPRTWPEQLEQSCPLWEGRPRMLQAFPEEAPSPGLLRGVWTP